MSKNIGGACFLHIDGTSYSTSGEFSGNVGAVKREEVLDSSGEIMFTETPQSSKVSGTIYLTESLRPSIISDMVDGTVQVVLRNGKTILLSGAFFDGEGAFNAKDGTMDVSFCGKGKWV